MKYQAGEACDSVAGAPGFRDRRGSDKIALEVDLSWAKAKTYIWPIIGIAAVALSIWLLVGELRHTSWVEIKTSLSLIGWQGWVLAILSAIVAYGALAGYDHIALLHLGRPLPWFFVTVCSFTTYALSHNIGSSVFSGAVVRYRAYSSRGLSGQEIATLIAICSLTFALSIMLLTGIVLILYPDLLDRFADLGHLPLSTGVGVILIGIVGLYILGSLLHLKPLKIGSVTIHYPSPPIVARQLIIGPLEILAAAAIIYFALPAGDNPGYLVILGVFLISFSAALLSHAPGGLGVLEYVFIQGLPDVDPASVMAALLVFRLLYLIIPLILALVVVVTFERSQFARGHGS